MLREHNLKDIREFSVILAEVDAQTEEELEKARGNT
jgi:hypothetical protein